MINMTRKIPRPYNTVRGEITRCTTLLPRKLSSALGAPVTGRDRPALFRRDTPGPVQRSASAGSHQPPALFRGPCSVFFPSQSFAKIKDIVPALPGFVNPGFPGGYLKSDVGFFCFRVFEKGGCSKVLCGVFSFRAVRGKAVAVKFFVGFRRRM